MHFFGREIFHFWSSIFWMQDSTFLQILRCLLGIPTWDYFIVNDVKSSTCRYSTFISPGSPTSWSTPVDKITSVSESLRFNLLGRLSRTIQVSWVVSRKVFGSYESLLVITFLDMTMIDGTKVELLTFKSTTSSFRKRSIMIYELWIIVQNSQF